MISYNLLFLFGFVAVITHAQLQLIQSWKYLQYDYSGLGVDNRQMQDNSDTHKQNVPIDVDVAPDGRMFVTVERQKDVPSSLNTVTSEMGEGGGPYLMPYPDWSWTNTSNCDNIIGVFRMTIDRCDRLWVLDNGNIGGDLVCPPKLLAFNLLTDQLVERVDISQELLGAPGNGKDLVTVVVEIGFDCSMAKAYMADGNGNQLLVWDGTNVFPFQSSFFEAEDDGSEFSVNDSDFNLERGVTALALTPDKMTPMDPTLLYFRPLSSKHLYYTNVADLTIENSDGNSTKYFTEPTKLDSQSAAHAFSSNGILFFNPVSDNSIVCWNRHKTFTSENIVAVAQNDESLQWASALKVRPSLQGEMLWVMTNRYQQVETDTLDDEKVNFYVLAGLVDELVSGTNCVL